jgi:hypothetical protein
MGFEFDLTQGRREIQWPSHLERGRNLLEQFRNRPDSNRLQHLRPLVGGVDKIGHTESPRRGGGDGLLLRERANGSQ